MTNIAGQYTYRAGQKIPLIKKPDEFVVRALPDDLTTLNSREVEQVSSASSRITVHANDLDGIMDEVRQEAVAHHAYQVPDTNQEFLITDRVFVTFHNALTSAEVMAFAGRYALVQLESYSEREYLFQLTDKTSINPIKLVVKLMEEEPLVQMADHDLNYRMSKMREGEYEVPTDPHYTAQWHLHTRFNHPLFDQRASTRCEKAWESLDNFGSSDVVVAITDDGCKMTHHDFDSAQKFAGWGYFRKRTLVREHDIEADPNQMYKWPDQYGGYNHGTACAGVAAASVDAKLTVGAAPGCRLLPIKWQSRGRSLFISDSKLLTALNSIADQVDVMCNSWGSTPTMTWSLKVTERIAELAQTGGRRGRGIVFLWAAGNENCPINYTSNQKIPYTNGWQSSWQWVGPRSAQHFSNNLVDISGVMHVAALSSSAQRSHYSNYGPGIDICAPSSNSHIYRRLSVSGLGITTTTGPTKNGIQDNFGGTSSATPLVAGIAALVISANANLTATEVVSILKRSASKELNFEGYPKTPPSARLEDLDTSWDVSPVAPFDNGQFIDTEHADGTWSPWFGHGRVDAAAAVEMALGMKSHCAQPMRRFQSTDDDHHDDHHHIKSITEPLSGDMMHTQKLIELLRAEFGPKFHDVRHLMARHSTNLPRPVDFNALTGIAVHHTAFHGLWKTAAKYHVNKLGWPTIAYTVGVSFGRVFLLKNVEEMGYHVWGMNEKLLSVVVMGDLTKRKPYSEDKPLLEGVIRCYDGLLGRQLKVRGHSDWALPGHKTQCPGPALKEWARNLQRTRFATRSLDDEEMQTAELPSSMSSYDISPTILGHMELRGDEPLGGEQDTEKYTFTLGEQGLYVWAKESDQVKVVSAQGI